MYSVNSFQSTCIVGNPIGGAYEMDFDSMRDPMLRFVPQEQDAS